MLDGIRSQPFNVWGPHIVVLQHMASGLGFSAPKRLASDSQLSHPEGRHILRPNSASFSGISFDVEHHDWVFNGDFIVI